MNVVDVLSLFVRLKPYFSICTDTCVNPVWHVYSKHYSAMSRGCISPTPPGLKHDDLRLLPPLAGVVPFVG